MNDGMLLIMVHASLCFPYMYTLSSNSPIFRSRSDKSRCCCCCYLDMIRVGVCGLTGQSRICSPPQHPLQCVTPGFSCCSSMSPIPLPRREGQTPSRWLLQSALRSYLPCHMSVQRAPFHCRGHQHACLH